MLLLESKYISYVDAKDFQKADYSLSMAYDHSDNVCLLIYNNKSCHVYSDVGFQYTINSRFDDELEMSSLERYHGLELYRELDITQFLPLQTKQELLTNNSLQFYWAIGREHHNLIIIVIDNYRFTYYQEKSPIPIKTFLTINDFLELEGYDIICEC